MPENEKLSADIALKIIAVIAGAALILFLSVYFAKGCY